MSIQLAVRNMTKRYKTGEGVTGINLEIKKKGSLSLSLDHPAAGKQRFSAA